MYRRKCDHDNSLKDRLTPTPIHRFDFPSFLELNHWNIIHDFSLSFYGFKKEEEKLSDNFFASYHWDVFSWSSNVTFCRFCIQPLSTLTPFIHSRIHYIKFTLNGIEEKINFKFQSRRRIQEQILQSYHGKLFNSKYLRNGKSNVKSFWTLANELFVCASSDSSSFERFSFPSYFQATKKVKQLQISEFCQKPKARINEINLRIPSGLLNVKNGWNIQSVWRVYHWRRILPWTPF